jgi:Putative peptidoglycan-binding domain-containing protein
MSSLTDRVTSTAKLNILVRTLLELALADIKEQGVTPLIYETYRSQERQNYLYCQGRTVEEVTKKGISKAFAQKYCTPNASKVTWTLNSVHKSRKAVDLIPMRKINGKWTAIWNANDAQTKIIISTMQKYGFEAGINWKNNPDSPHYQIDGTFTTLFTSKYNTVYVTKVIQKALNSKISAKLTVDGDWGAKTTAAVNTFRKKQGYKTAVGQLGDVALKALFK